MQIRHCESCGAQLPQLASAAGTTVNLCDKCAAARGGKPTTPVQIPTPPTSRKSSAGGLRGIETDTPSGRTSPGGTLVAAPGNATPPPPAPVQNAPTGSMGFYFCEKCGKRVTEADLAAGRARNKQLSGVFCGGCSEGAMTLAFDAISSDEILKDGEHRRTSTRRSTSTRLPAPKAVPGAAARRPHAEATPRRPVSKAVVAGVVVTALSVVIGVLVIGWGGADPTRPSNSEPPADVSTAPPVSPSRLEEKAALASGESPAARRLSEIQAMITGDLQKYAEVRQMLEQFMKAFADTPEAESAKALQSEIDRDYAKLAENALSEALTAVRAGASSGTFDEAESKLRSIENRFGNGTWFESKGKDAVAEALADIARQRAEWKLKELAGTIEKARVELQAGRFAAADRLIAKREEWPTEVRSQANELAADIKRKAAKAAEAKKLAEEREAILADFDRLMISGDYTKARDYAKSKATAGGPVAEILRGGERLAGKLAEEPAAIIRGARTQIGREMRLKLTNGEEKAIVKAVTDAGLNVATIFKINNEAREKPRSLKWNELHPDQKNVFAQLGGFEMSASDTAIMAAYEALASKDLTAAGQAVGDANADPLGAHLADVVRTRQKQLAYESAMAEAKELLAAKKLRGAEGACGKALDAKPDDEEAVALLEEVRRRLTAPQTLTLDIGDGLTMEFVYIKPGTFVMGGESTTESRFAAVEVPKHTVTITKGFYLGKYEVTQAQFQAVMGKNPSKSTKDPNCPVDCVVWPQESEFCNRVAKKTGRDVRLPTEAEWEYACRAGTDSDWGHVGDPSKLVEYAWIADNSGGRSHPVGQKKPNPWGLYDMQGNVCERVADFYHRDYYASSPKEDPTGPKGKFGNGNNGTTILRGGTWKSGRDECRAGKRLRGGGYGFYDNWGFRAAVSATGED